MYIIGINGSPNKDGNTAYLLNRALKKAEEIGARTEMIHAAEVLQSFAIPFCTVCSSPCKGICAEKTPFAEVLDKLRKADGVLVGSPVYFGTVTGQIKAFWDKLRCLRAEKKLLNTIGGAITVGATRSGGQENTMRIIHEMMLVQGMTIVGAGQADYDCGHFGVGALRPAMEDKQAQERVEIMATRICEVAAATTGLRF